MESVDVGVSIGIGRHHHQTIPRGKKVVPVWGNFEKDGRMPLKPVVIVVWERATVDLRWHDSVVDLLVQMCGIGSLFPEMRCERRGELHHDVRYGICYIANIRGHTHCAIWCIWYTSIIL